MSNVTPVEQLKNTIVQMRPQFLKALPKHISIDKFERALYTAVAATPKLAEMDRNSVLAACLKAANDGLLPDGKEAALVPFKGAAQYLPMFAGILKKMRNSGELLSIEANIVHKNDKFSYRIGVDLLPVFEPDWFGERGEAIGVYAVGKTKDGGLYVEIMNKADVYKTKAAGAGASSSYSPWNGPFEHEMWKKAVIRRIAKKMPSSTDLDGLFGNDDENYDFKQPANQVDDQSAAQQPVQKTSRLEKLVSRPAPQTGVDQSPVVRPAVKNHAPTNQPAPSVANQPAIDIDAESLPI